VAFEVASKHLQEAFTIMSNTASYSKLGTALAVAVAVACFSDVGLVRAAWPDGPLTTSGRWMRDATGAQVTYAGVNWPGSADTMLPEGLQYQSIESIVSAIKSTGMNSVRLTYATEMVDQIYDNDGNDVTMLSAFTDVLGSDDGQGLFDQVIANNPSFDTQTTRLQVYPSMNGLL
jgi:hypothetical protein